MIDGQGLEATRALGSRYVLGPLLGSGAMGEVFVARDVATGERCAAKLLRSEFARDPAIVARFVQERSLLLDLRHEGIVRVRDLVVEGDDLALVMDLVDGPDLRARLRSAGRLVPAEACRIVGDVLDALAYAHGRSVLHRDVKPDNVLMTTDEPGRVLLTDFGIARLAQETTVRMTGVLGTAEYMAPEIFTDEAVSPAADVYAAGILLYELLAGHTPFAGGGNAYAVAHRHVHALPPPLPGLPSRLASVLPDLLRKDPRQRPTAAAAADALRRLSPDLAGLAALPETPPATSWEQLAGPGPGAAGAAGIAVRGNQPPDLSADPAATALRGLDRIPPPGTGPLPADSLPAGPVAARAAPDPAGQVDPSALDQLLDDTGTTPAGSTRLRPGPAGGLRSRALDVPDVEASADPRTPWWRSRSFLVAVAVTAVLVVLVGAVGLLAHGSGRSGSRPAAAGADQVSVTGSIEQHPSGLTVLRQASYDPTDQQATVTISYTAGAAALTGPFFESVPATAPGAPCPDAGWDRVGAVRDTTTGIDPSSCGWEVDVATVSSGAQTDATYTVPFVPAKGTDVRQALSAYLKSSAGTTSDALSHLATNPAYPAQRLSDLEVDISGAVRVGSHISAVVVPVWDGSSGPDFVDPLFDSSTSRTGPLVRALGGTLTLTSDDCSSSIGFTANAPYANTQAQRCTITARLGQLSGHSRTFDIGLNTGG